MSEEGLDEDGERDGGCRTGEKEGSRKAGLKG